jgi:hypothetical protein
VIKYSKGNTITQYVIILALLLLALVPGFFLIGKNITGYFTKFSEVYGNKEISGVTSQDNTSIMDNQGAENVDVNCQSGNCTITYKDFTLNNVPDNFADIIETTGTAGGTETLASLIKQVGDTASEVSVNEETRSKIDQLASLAFKIAEEEKFIEDFSGDILDMLHTIKQKIDTNYLDSLASDQEKVLYIEQVAGEDMAYLNEVVLSGNRSDSFEQKLLNIMTSSDANNLMMDAQLDPLETLQSNDRAQFDALLTELTADASDLPPPLKNVLATLGGDVQMLANNMTNSMYDTLQQYQSMSPELSAEMITVYPEAEYAIENAFMEQMFSSLKNANNGLTSEQTNLDGKLIEASDNNNLQEEESTNQQTEEVSINASSSSSTDG